MCQISCIFRQNVKRCQKTCFELLWTQIAIISVWNIGFASNLDRSKILWHEIVWQSFEKIRRRDVTWRHFWFWRQKCADVSKNGRTKPLFDYYIQKVLSDIFQTRGQPSSYVKQKQNYRHLKNVGFLWRHRQNMTSRWRHVGFFDVNRKFIWQLSFVPSFISLAYH